MTISKELKNIKETMKWKISPFKTVSVDEKDLKKVVEFLDSFNQFSCTKENIGNLSNYLESGKEYIVMVKEASNP